MEIAIGMQFAPRELRLDVKDDAASVRKTIDAAIDGGGMLWLTDKNGTQVGVPVDKLAFIEIDEGRAHKKVGFAPDD